MDTLERLSNWFFKNCDDDWEHSDRISICNIDNPGWRVDISLEDTVLEDVAFERMKYGDPENRYDKWIDCSKNGSVFVGLGSVDKLAEILDVFLDWVEKRTDTTPWDEEVEALFEEIKQATTEENSAAIAKLRKVYYKFYDIPNEHPKKKLLMQEFNRTWNALYKT